MLHSFILHLLNSVKWYYFARLKYLVGLIKSYMANSQAGERMGGIGRHR